METAEFDATLGGNEHLPFSANSLKFAASRSIEIAAMTESILRPSKTKLIFQTLPVHMRRRVMSHNSKRLPRKLREGHLEQLKKSGLPPKQKRPSRKYRRRPANLLQEYNRRQKLNIWLETHIWHAKRFHMIERWRHRLAYAPCDKAFRACYRASSAHCLLQDISYYTPIKITGCLDAIEHMFRNLTTKSCGLGVCAKAYISGKREGTIHLYKENLFPFGYIGKISFVWVSENFSKHLWLFVHPSQINEITSVLTKSSNQFMINSNEIPQKKRKLEHNEKVQIDILPGVFNRYRFTGPNSHAVLTSSLKCISDVEKIKMSEWTTLVPGNYLMDSKEKFDYWQNISLIRSAAQLPPRIVIGLIVKDPRLSRPLHRTKAQPVNNDPVNVNSLIETPLSISTSPLWNSSIHESIKNKRMSNAQFIEHVTKTQLVPGEIYEDDPELQSVPVILIQRPGSQNPNFKKIGYGSGWDVIVPSGYGLPFWQTFIMFGARAGGLRETENMAFEMGECYLPLDSEAGKEDEKRIESKLKEKYFRLPPSKRVNYIKLAINSPFICPWKILLKDWSGDSVDDIYILRDKKLLEKIQECMQHKNEIPEIKNSANCLVAVYIQVVGKGNLKRHALICLPKPGDISAKSPILEPRHNDPNEKLRKQKRLVHKIRIKQWRRKRIKLKKQGTIINAIKCYKKQKDPSEYVKTMRELWLPSEVTNVRYSMSREVLGYLTQAAFSFSEAQSCGIGFIAYNTLHTLIKNFENQILVRNTTSRAYRFAKIKIIESTLHL